MTAYHDSFHHVLESHVHRVTVWKGVGDDEFVELPVRAVVVDTNGGMVELGDFSFTPGEAWLLAQSLLILASVANPDHRRENVIDPVAFEQRLRNEGAT